MRATRVGQTLPSAHAVDREARVLTALVGSAVLVPPVLLFHAETDVVGPPFYGMERAPTCQSRSWSKSVESAKPTDR